MGALCSSSQREGRAYLRVSWNGGIAWTGREDRREYIALGCAAFLVGAWATAEYAYVFAGARVGSFKQWLLHVDYNNFYRAMLMASAHLARPVTLISSRKHWRMVTTPKNVCN